MENDGRAPIPTYISSINKYQTGFRDHKFLTACLPSVIAVKVPSLPTVVSRSDTKKENNILTGMRLQSVDESF